MVTRPALLDLGVDVLRGAVLDHRQGPLLVTGPPGAGKTTLLRERFARLVEDGVDPERIALFALSRRAAREARDWVIRRLSRSVGDLPVFTVHGHAYRAMSRRFRELDYEEVPQVLSAPEQYAVIRDLLGSEAVHQRDRWPRFHELLTVPAFQRQVADFVLRCQERLLDPDGVQVLVDRGGHADHAEVASFYRRYLDALSQAGQIDFGGLLFQVVSLLGSGLSPADRFEHVMVDDYQDATHAAEAVVGLLGRAADSVILAADPDGHVFSYRGGSVEPLRRADRTLPGLRRVTLEDSPRLSDDLPALTGLNAGGRPPASAPRSIEARLFAHPGEEVEAVAHELLRVRIDEDVPWSDMGVIVRRYGGYLTGLRHALVRHGIPFVIVAEEAALAAEPACRPVIDLLRFVLRPELRERLLESLLTSQAGGLDPYGLRRLRREARFRDVPLLRLVEGADAGRPLPSDLDRAVREFRALVGDVERWAGTERPDGVFFALWTRLPSFARMVAGASDERGEDWGGVRAGDRDLDALAALSAALTRFSERRPDAGMQDYLDTLDAAEFGPDPWIPPEERHPDAVRVVSGHRAQGMEFRAVMVAGCLEGEFPSLSHAFPLVSLDLLTETRTPWERTAARLAEERALFRLAVSRTRGRTVLFASKSTGVRTPRTPSRFAAALGVQWDTPAEEAPPSTSLRSMEAALRRRIGDRGETAARRLAAAACLSSVGATPSAWWGRRDWTDPGVPLYPDEIRTSYSRLSTMDNCALQYLYQVEMGLDPEQSHQMWVGSLIHGIIDRTQRGELPRDIDELYAALEREWRPEIFPNRAVEHRRLLDARLMLSRWFKYEAADPERSEVWFEFPLDGAVIRGRIDAVFRTNSGDLRVVDYKTSRYPITEEQARTDLQLAAYYLALRRTPELAALGKPRFLQLDYLGKPHARDGFVSRRVTPSQIDGYEEWAQATIRGLVDSIREERFAPSPEADCTFCSFRTICPRWAEGREPPVTAASRRGPS
jgi:superfamily I DNA/RNA helicase/RecB family exonuclease